jgi:VanZ family protein
MAAIFLESSQSHVPDLPAGLSNHTGHFLAYGALAIAALRGFAGATWTGVGARAAIFAVALASVYGLSDEFHQRFVPNRMSGLDDWAADTLGAITAVVAVLLIARARRKRLSRTRDV